MDSIGILETGLPPPALAARFGRYDAMVRRMLGDRYHTRTYAVRNGELPARVEDHDAYVITGSSAGAYEDLPWIAPLEAFIRAAQGRARMVGLCFGHQIMAQALGGRVARSDKGWGLGLHRYAVLHAEPWMAAEPSLGRHSGADPRMSASSHGKERQDRAGEPGLSCLAVAASHQDQVVVPPEGAVVLAASAFTPYAALLYADGEALSFQFHPEFERGMAEALVALRRPDLPDGEAERMLASLAEPSDAPRVAAWIRAFLDRPPRAQAWAKSQ